VRKENFQSLPNNTLRSHLSYIKAYKPLMNLEAVRESPWARVAGYWRRTYLQGIWESWRGVESINALS